MARNSRWPLASSWQGIQVLSPTALKESNSASSHMSLEGNPFPVQPSDEIIALSPGQHLDCNPVRDYELEDVAEPCLVSWPTQTVR